MPTEPIPDAAKASASFFCSRLDSRERWFSCAEDNRLIVKSLRGWGYPATLHEVPDMHNCRAWRDAFRPYLTELLGQACR